ncbi:SRPBCC family protein [Brachybacterium sp. UNK5269]|uniref:SRPBCC family protein n=1 Tax=Brachybacterium sp. UNK5269 TaxID=3408576 RepID=UPI003BB05B81
MTSTDPILRHDAGRDAVVIERRFAHPLERVWRAVTEPEHLARWFPGAPEFELRAGGAVRFPEFAGEAAEHGRVLECEPPHRLRFTWDTDELLFELLAEGDGTRLVLTHAFDDSAGAASFATGWETCLEHLRAVLGGGEVPEPGPRPERHEELAARFGLGRPEVARTTDGWSLRVERQLVCPADAAWDLLLGGGAGSPAGTLAPAVGQELRAPRHPELLLGHLTAVEAPTLLVFDAAPEQPGDEVRVELTEGTGHGVRLVLTVRGAEPGEQAPAVQQWGIRAVDLIARAALGAVAGARTGEGPSATTQ